MDAYIVDAVRTPRGKARASGGLHALRPVDLIAQLLGAIAARNEFEPEVVDDVVLGCVTQVGDQGANIAKTAALYAGWPDTVPGMTVNRFCSSGLDAVAVAATRIAAGMADVICAGGVESMSRVPMFGDKGAWFADPEVAAATGFVHMGIAADLLASRERIARTELDGYVLQSHRRAAAADFSASLIPARDRQGAVVLEQDELVRPELDAAKLAALPALFADTPPGPAIAARYPDVTVRPMHTIASSPGIADGASIVLVAGRDATARAGWTPRARIRAVASTSVEPVQMLHGNIDCTRRVLDRAGLGVGDVDLFEVNESFAAVPLQYQRALDIDADRLNVSGGAIAMGHPLGATGGMLLAILTDDLVRRDGAIGVASICGGAGVATAVVVERI